MTTTVHPTAIPAPSISTIPLQKYDRQIRIWGDEGQIELQRASLCLFSASAAGTETMKNLILPGIGSVTVVDGTPIGHYPPPANFFAHNLSSDVTNRAQAVVQCMQQLNDQSHLLYIPHHPQVFINSPSSAYAFIIRFSVVVIADMPQSDPTVQYISDACYRANIPLILLRCYGMIGYLRVQTADLFVLNSREDNLVPDLCLHSRFPPLEQRAKSINLQNITDTTRLSHIPFVLILTKAIARFRDDYNGKLPSSKEEKSGFKQIVEALRPQHCPKDAQNFEEAMKPSNLRLCYAEIAKLPPSVQAVLSHKNSHPKTSQAFFVTIEPPDEHVFPQTVRYANQQANSKVSTSEKRSGDNSDDLRRSKRIAEERARFWLLAAAVRMFVEETGRLPVRGSLPDMTSDTESYIGLQQMYSEEGRKNAKSVFQFVQRIVEDRNVSVQVDEKYSNLFCKNIHAIRAYRTSSIANEHKNFNSTAFMEAAMIDAGIEASSSGNASPFYAILHAVDAFHRENGRYPGSIELSKGNDLSLMHEYVSNVKDILGLSSSGLWRDQTEEMVRYANAEVHNVAAFMGGVAAQEITKIITKQFVPLDNTLIVNFAEQNSVSFRV